jgi:hypothetical protein
MIRPTQIHSFEQLESRQMLSAHPFAHGAAIALGHSDPLAHLPTPTATFAAGAAQAQGTLLSAKLSDPANPDVEGSARFVSFTAGGMPFTSLSVSIEGAAPNSMHEVTIKGVVVGTLMTDAEGEGHLTLSSNPHGGQQPLPANFPTGVMAGDMVSVGAAAGKLAVGMHEGDDDDGGDQNENENENESETHLAATLADPASAAVSGHATFKSETDDGKTETTFAVSITGAAVNAMLNVKLQGTIIGVLKTDANGAGKLVLSSENGTLPANFPTTVMAGDTVMVGAATGALAAIMGGNHDDQGDQNEDEDENENESETHLAATLADPANTDISGRAALKTETDDGTTETTFAVSIKGATPNSMLNVTLQGVMIGIVKTDGTGAGKLVLSSENGTLPANFPTTVMAGDKVMVGTATGTLAVITEGGDHDHQGEDD